MNQSEQLAILDNTGDLENFSDKLRTSQHFPLKASNIEVLQINVSKRCNLSCKHCHVQAGPDRKEVMSQTILEKCLNILNRSRSVSVIDITGGSPEMNPHLEWFIEQAAKLNKRLIVRTNLLILLSKEYRKYIDLYSRNRVEIMCSLPDYHSEKSDRQRGFGSFNKCVEVLSLLNDIGYGKNGSGLTLNIVHNPVGAYLPGSQHSLEYEYKKHLKNKFGVEFNNLFCITNLPVGRYLEYLLASDNYSDYLQELIKKHNPHTVTNLMCRTMVSVGRDGKLYDCDFNQVLGLTVSDKDIQNIDDFDEDKLGKREIVMGNHCYGCTAGSGSSCQGCLE